MNLNIHWENWCWSWNSNTLATWDLTHWKRVDGKDRERWESWERLMVGEGKDRGWDGWMASPTQWTWIWVNSGSWWRIGKPDVLRSLESQRVRHNWATELNWTLAVQAFSSYGRWSFSMWWLPLLQSTALGVWASVAVHGLSCSTACGTFPEQGLNPCARH